MVPKPKAGKTAAPKAQPEVYTSLQAAPATAAPAAPPPADEIKTVYFTKFKPVVKECHGCKKVPVLFDKTGNLRRYYEYQGKTCDVAKLVIGLAMGKETNVGDEMRQKYVVGAIHGGTVVYNFGQALPTKMADYLILDADCKEDGVRSKNWKKYDEGDKTTVEQYQSLFCPHIVFDLDRRAKRDEFAKVVQDHEDMDNLGNREVWPDPDGEVCMMFDISGFSEAPEEKIKEFMSEIKAEFGPKFTAKNLEAVLVSDPPEE